MRIVFQQSKVILDFCFYCENKRCLLRLIVSKNKKDFERMSPEVTKDIYQQSSNINGRLLSMFLHGI